MRQARRIGLLVLATLVLGPLGVVAVRALGPHPPREHPSVVVMTSWPGAAPADVEKSVTIPLERALSGVRGISSESSTSLLGVSSVRLELAQGANELVVRQEVMERLRNVDLPPGTFPELARGGARSLTFAIVTNDEISSREARSIADWDIAPLMKRIPGVLDVTTCGGQVARTEVRLDPKRLRTLGVRPTDVVDNLYARSLRTEDSPGLRGAATFTSMDALRKTPVGKTADKVLTVADVGDVANGSTTPACIAANRNGESTISEITLQADADVEKVARDVSAELQKLPGRFPVRIVIPMEMEKRAPFVHVRAWLPTDERNLLFEAIGKVPQVADVYARSTENETEFFCRAAPNVDATKLARALARTLSSRQDFAFDLTSPQVELPRELRVARLRLTGPDLEMLREVAQHLMFALHDTEGVNQGVVPEARMRKHMVVKPDRARMTALGVPEDAATRTLLLSTEGQVVGSFQEHERRMDLVVTLAKPAVQGTDELANLVVARANGDTVPLSVFAEVTAEQTPFSISRSNGSRVMDLYFNARDEGALEAARRALKKIPLPMDLSLTLTREGD